jgi:hypothetical protein
MTRPVIAAAHAVHHEQHRQRAGEHDQADQQGRHRNAGILNLYLQQVLGLSASPSGSALLPMTTFIMLGMIVVARS